MKHMNKMQWAVVIVAVVFAGAGFWGGMTYAASKTPAVSTSRFGTTGAAGFAGRGGAGFAGAAGGATIGSVVQVGNGSFTVQLPSSTSTTATTGTKLVLVDNTTEVDELESVPVSNIQVGQTVTVAGTANSDGSITASSVMIRPATAGAGGGSAGATQTSGQ
jgi:hypothetical protein